MKIFHRSTKGAEVVDGLSNYVDGKTILVTGASVNGLGAETALCLARANPTHILLLGRTATKIDPVIAEIYKINDGIKTTFVPADLNNLASVRNAAEFISNQIQKLDLLINNAGIMAIKDFTKSKDGVESQLATNHLSHFLLTNLLMPKILAATPGARIVNLTSDGYLISPFRFDDYNFSDGADYDLWSGYGQSKTANILFTKQLAARLKPKGVMAFAVHPGVIMETSLGNHVDGNDFNLIEGITRKNTGKGFAVGEPKTRQEGVSTTLVAALDPRLEDATGSYLEDCAVKATAPHASSMEDAQRLWDLSERLVGQKFAI